jgi:septal ring factor EnvC (AmiA/AmiB activator)
MWGFITAAFTFLFTEVREGLKTINTRLDRMEKEMSDANQTIRDTNTKLKALEPVLEEITADIKSLQDKIAELQVQQPDNEAINELAITADALVGKLGGIAQSV